MPPPPRSRFQKKPTSGRAKACARALSFQVSPSPVADGVWVVLKISNYFGLRILDRHLAWVNILIEPIYGVQIPQSHIFLPLNFASRSIYNSNLVSRQDQFHNSGIPHNFCANLIISTRIPTQNPADFFCSFRYPTQIPQKMPRIP